MVLRVASKHPSAITFWLLQATFTYAASCSASDAQSTIVHSHRYYESQKLAIL
jgi:hypothetical protein